MVSNEPAFDPPREWVPAAPPKPAPVEQVERAAPPTTGGKVLAGVAGFAVGTAVGICGLLAWQGRFTTTPVETVAATQPGDTRPAVATKPVEVAPLPRAVSPVVPEPATPTAVEPVAPAVAQAAPPVAPAVVPVAVPVVVKAAGKAVVIEVNEPDGEYTLAVPMQRGEHVILKGKVGTLKLGTIEAGSTLDATNLDADTITVSGKIDGGAEVKLNAPFGTVNVMGRVDGGAKLSITGRIIYLNSGVGGNKTHVKAVIGRSGSLRVASAHGTAVVEYAAASSGWSEPDVVVGTVGDGAAVRKTEDK